MHFLINYLTQQGYSLDNLGLILILPLVMTVLSLARQIIGIRGLGLATTLMATLIFTISSFWYGLALIGLSVLIVSLLRWFTRKWHLLYLPRIVILLIIVLTLMILLLLIPLPSQQKISLVALVLAVAMAERVILVEIEKSRREAVLAILETIILALIGYGLIIWRPLQKLVLVRPDAVILGAILINLVLGKWTNLRLNEYFRFRQVIKNIELAAKK